jgi:2,3-bisphosphoglycerate-independent phosphoglycerate mutase
LYSLVKAAKAHGIEHIYIHFFGDGRDTAPRSATKYIGQLQDFLKEQGVGEISTVVGRYYAMDRDKRWDRVKIAVDGLVQGKGDKVEGDLIKTIEKGYESDITDEFIKPIICGSEGSRLQSESLTEIHEWSAD